MPGQADDDIPVDSAGPVRSERPSRAGLVPPG